MVACERQCIPFDGNKMVEEEEPSLLLTVSTLEKWGLDKWDIAEVNFKQDPYSHFAVYCTYK